MAIVEDVRDLGAVWSALGYEVFVHGRLKFRVGQLVYVAFSLDETVMGFGFLRRSARRWWVATRASSTCRPPQTCVSIGSMPILRHWIGEAREIVVDAWRMVVPQKVFPARTTSPIPTARADSARIRPRAPPAVVRGGS